MTIGTLTDAQPGPTLTIVEQCQDQRDHDHDQLTPLIPVKLNCDRLPVKSLYGRSTFNWKVEVTLLLVPRNAVQLRNLVANE